MKEKSGFPISHDKNCPNCDGQGIVCENHWDRPWRAVSHREDACECGAGMSCQVCTVFSSDEGSAQP